MKLHNSNPWCVVVDDVDHVSEVVRVIEKCNGCEYGVGTRLEIYEDKEETEKK